MRRAGGVLLCLILASTLMGFRSLDVKEIRKEVRQELARIKEMTPGAKQRKEWLEGRKKAVTALEDAFVSGARRYAPKLWQESLSMLDLADSYASKREFLKASYLASKVAETAGAAGEEAMKRLQSLKERYRQGIDRLYVLLRRRVAALPEGERNSVEILRLRLGIKDLENALDLEQFQQVREGIQEMNRRLSPGQGR